MAASNDPNPLETPSPVRLAGPLGFLAQFFIVLWGISVARPLLIPICLAILVAYVIAPLVEILRRMKVPEIIALPTAVVLVSLPFLGAGYAIMRQVNALSLQIPSLMASANGALAKLSHSSLATRLHLGQALNLNAIQGQLVNRAEEGLRFAFEGLSALVDAGSTFGLVIIFALLMVASRTQLRRSAEKIITHVSPDFGADTFIREVASLVQRFLLARLIITFIVGALAALTLSAFGVQYGLLMGALLGVLTLIPTIGFMIGIVPPLLVASMTGHSLMQVICLFGVFMVLAVFEANYLTPKLVGGRLNINSLTAFIGLFAGGLAWGVWGMLLSIPFLAILRICLSLSPRWQPWAELLAEHDQSETTRRILRRKAVIATPVPA